MPEHSIFSPSSCERWFNCPASVPLTLNSDNTESEYAIEGTAAHALSAFALENKITAFEALKSIDKSYTKLSTYYSEEMAKILQDGYLDPINVLVENAICFVEYKVDLSDIYKDQFGTSDLVAYNEKDNILQIHDLKYGKGEKVEANKNKQLMLYAIGAIKSLSLFYNFKDDLQIKLYIHQPRLFHTSEFSTNLSNLDKFKLKVIKIVDYINNLLQNPGLIRKDDFSPSEKTCKWCLNKGNCKHLANYNMGIISDMFGDINETSSKFVENVIDLNTNSLSENAIAVILDNEKLFTSWLNSVKSNAFDVLKKGGKIPGYKLVMGNRSHKKWFDEVETEKVLKSMRMPESDIYKKTLQTPTNIMSKVKGSVRKTNRITKLIDFGEKKEVIAKEDDKREEAVTVNNLFEDLIN